jgi:solute carrier family 24 (sodium/potassium/calcium exchanger), member 6
MRSGPPSIRRTVSGQSVDEDGKRIRKVPSILLTSASGDESLVQPSSIIPPGAFAVVTHRRGYRIARAVFLALFPSLQDFRDKSWVGRATALLCVPAILVLNLTLPVVDSDADDCASLEEKEARAESEDGYRDYDSDDEEQEGPREGFLVDTDDLTRTPPHHYHRDRSDIDRQHREEAARALHGRVLPHAEMVDGVEVASPWATTPSHTPMGEEGRDDIRQSFARFSIASENGTANHVRSSTEGTIESVKSEGQASPPNLEVHANVLTRWLTAVQCTLGPVFCVTALLSEFSLGVLSST